MTTYWLKGEITPDRQLKVDLPSDIPAGTVQIAVLPEGEGVAARWTEAEVEAMFAQKAKDVKTGAAIVAELGDVIGSWADLEIDDPVEWLLEQRRLAENKRGITW
jgi:hypothetical protein